MEREKENKRMKFRLQLNKCPAGPIIYISTYDLQAINILLRAGEVVLWSTVTS